MFAQRYRPLFYPLSIHQLNVLVLGLLTLYGSQMEAQLFVKLRQTFRVTISMVAILIFNLVADRFIEPDEWARTAFLIFMLLTLSLASKWVYSTKENKVLHRPRRSRPIVFLFLSYAFSIALLISLLERVPILYPDGIWIEITILASLYLCFHFAVAHYIDRHYSKTKVVNNSNKQ